MKDRKYKCTSVETSIIILFFSFVLLGSSIGGIFMYELDRPSNFTEDEINKYIEVANDIYSKQLAGEYIGTQRDNIFIEVQGTGKFKLSSVDRDKGFIVFDFNANQVLISQYKTQLIFEILIGIIMGGFISVGILTYIFLILVLVISKFKE